MRSSLKSELISGLCGGIVFLVIYLVGDHFVVSLICGAVIFLIARLLFRKDSKPQIPEYEPVVPEKTEDIVARAKTYLGRIEFYQTKVKNEEILSYLSGILIINKKMLKEADGSDNDRKIAKELVNFYMPSLCKIMDEYLPICENRGTSKKAAKFEQEVVYFLRELLEGFERQLEAMLADNIYDAKLEIEHVKNILKSDGFLGNDDFNMEEGE